MELPPLATGRAPWHAAAVEPIDTGSREARTPITWPAPLTLPSWATGLSWGASLAALRAAGAGTEIAAQAPITRWSFSDPVTLRGIALQAIAVLELDTLVRIELSGPLDALTLAGFGLDDSGYTRMHHDETSIEVDALDGRIALEHREAP